MATPVHALTRTSQSTDVKEFQSHSHCSPAGINVSLLMVTEEGPDSTVTVAVASSVRRFTFGCGYTVSSTEPGSGGEGGDGGGVFSHCGCRVFLDCKKQQSKLVRRGSCPKCFV